jgi:hypothetical protein
VRERVVGAAAVGDLAPWRRDWARWMPHSARRRPKRRRRSARRRRRHRRADGARRADRGPGRPRPQVDPVEADDRGYRRALRAVAGSPGHRAAPAQEHGPAAVEALPRCARHARQAPSRVLLGHGRTAPRRSRRQGSPRRARRGAGQ